MPWNTRAPSWTDPTGGKGGQPNFKFDRQYGNRLGNMRNQLVGQNDLGIATQQALGSVAQIMQKYKQDKIAEALTQRDAQNFNDPEALNRLKQMGLSGSDARNQFLADMKFNLSRKDAQQQQQAWDEEGKRKEVDNWYKDQLNNKKLYDDDSDQGVEYVETPYGRMRAGEWARLRGVGPGEKEKTEQIQGIDKQIADAQGNIASGNKRYGPDWLPLTSTYADQLKELQAKRQALVNPAGAAMPPDPQQSPPAPQQPNQPQVGEKRTVNGVPAQWDGQGWVKAE